MQPQHGLVAGGPCVPRSTAAQAAGQHLPPLAPQPAWRRELVHRSGGVGRVRRSGAQPRCQRPCAAGLCPGRRIGKAYSTAIVACAWDRMTQKVVLVWHRVFQPSPADPLDFEASIEASLFELHRNFRVQTVWFELLSDAIQRAAVDARRRADARVSADRAELDGGVARFVRADNRQVWRTPMRLAVSRAVALETARGWRIAKEKQSHKIDVVVALAMAAHACVQGQATAPVVISQELLSRIMQMPRRREMGSARTPAMMFGTSPIRRSSSDARPSSSSALESQLRRDGLRAIFELTNIPAENMRASVRCR